MIFNYSTFYTQTHIDLHLVILKTKTIQVGKNEYKQTGVITNEMR
jgi:hypothetical protein